MRDKDNKDTAAYFVWCENCVLLSQPKCNHRKGTLEMTALGQQNVIILAVIFIINSIIKNINVVKQSRTVI